VAYSPKTKELLSSTRADIIWSVSLKTERIYILVFHNTRKTFTTQYTYGRYNNIFLGIFVLCPICYWSFVVSVHDACIGFSFSYTPNWMLAHATKVTFSLFFTFSIIAVINILYYVCEYVYIPRRITVSSPLCPYALTHP